MMQSIGPMGGMWFESPHWSVSKLSSQQPTIVKLHLCKMLRDLRTYGMGKWKQKQRLIVHLSCWWIYRHPILFLPSENNIFCRIKKNYVSFITDKLWSLQESDCLLHCNKHHTEDEKKSKKQTPQLSLY